MFFTTTSIAVLGLASYASAHMKISNPVPYANAQLDNAPLLADGSNFPCKMVFDTTTPSTPMALGSQQTLKFIGGATHGGGSCQISITYDNPPNKNSVFKVIHSIEGGCPTKSNAGNIGTEASAPDPDTYGYTIPTDIPAGKATLAWTWNNKVGNREMYMNCAPIDLTGGSSKRSDDDELVVRNLTLLMERDQNAYSALPDMFKANILNIGADSCTTVEGVDVQYPNPGSSVDRPGTDSNLKPAVAGCGASSGGSPTSAASAPSAPAASAGVFATVPAGSAPAPTATASALASAAPVSSAAVAPPAASSAPPTAPTNAPATVAPSGSTTPGSACSPEGLWNCIGGTSFQRCASGVWSVAESVAAGTSCTPGQSAAINIIASHAKRSVRFSSEHIRRHIHRSS